MRPDSGSEVIMADEWFYSSKGQRYGPVSSEQLKQSAQSGQLLPTDLVWSQGAAGWLPAATVPDLFPSAASGDIHQSGSVSPPISPSPHVNYESLTPATSARQMVTLPGIFLMVSAAVGMLGSSVCAVVAYLQSVGIMAGGKDPASSAIAAVYFVVTVLASALVLIGGFKMLRLRSYQFVMASTVVAMIPCIGPCFAVLGVPFGIWAMVVLLKPEVKQAFLQNENPKASPL